MFSRLTVGFCLLLGLLIGSAQAQHDVSAFLKRSHGQSTEIFWYTYFGQNVVADIRYDFDWSNTLGAFVGKTYGFGPLSFTPAVGLLRGEYEGLSAETYVGGSWGKFSFFSLQQGTVCTDNSRLNDWLYHWTDFMLAAKPWLKLGVGEQVYYELTDGFQTKVDLGPTAKISFGQIYLKPWATFSPTHANSEMVIVGVGYAF